MAARIVEAHGGQLEVKMGAGAGAASQGACFCLRLPVDRAARVAS